MQDWTEKNALSVYSNKPPKYLDFFFIYLTNQSIVSRSKGIHTQEYNVFICSFYITNLFYFV